MRLTVAPLLLRLRLRLRVALQLLCSECVRRLRAVVRHPHHFTAAGLCALLMVAIGFSEWSHIAAFFVYAVGESIAEG